MPPQHASATAKPRRITAGLIFPWIFGGLFLFAGINSLTVNLISAVCMFLAAGLLIPPVSAYIQKKTNVELSTGAKVIAVIALIGLSTMFGTAHGKKLDTETPIPTPITPAEVPSTTGSTSDAAPASSVTM